MLVKHAKDPTREEVIKSRTVEKRPDKVTPDKEKVNNKKGK